MSFASLAQPEIGPLVERVAGARELTLLVGAGASMEAGLPSWRRLVEMLLETVAAELPGLDEEERAAWIEATLQRDDLLGAGAVVEVMAGGDLSKLIPDRLYGGQGPEAFAPGPIAHQVAELRKIWGEHLEILTTNYDDLLEQALIDVGTARTNIRSYTQNLEPDKRAQGTVAVTHLHGLSGRTGSPRGIVLTEEHYHSMQRGISWQEQLVTARLQDSTCVFVGTSLADPNLIRYLYGYEAPAVPRHAAIFVRQGEPQVPDAVRDSMEEAAARRWGRCGVQAIFVDHFADAAQLLYEIGHRKQAGSKRYRPVEERAGEVIACVERGLAVDDQKEFAERQVTLSTALRGVLDEILSLPRLKQGEEILGLALWVLTEDGSGLIGWVHSDRAHQDPSTVTPVPIGSTSSWVAVRAICQGTIVEFDREDYASRWHFVRGIPLVLEEPTRLPIGALTIASSVPAEKSVLTKMPEGARAALHHALQHLALRLLKKIIDAGK
ncbi:MAG: SIR2 family protein [Actinomycetota bacterium]|nr:SIR2 family protein [Actinomycetota bacterium]